ncbi:MAG: serine hydrolase [Saprospiraceae bacterium]|nr:serine hydrolase [Saprospiraceae bacterium]
MKYIALLSVLLLPLCLPAQKNLLPKLLKQHPDKFARVLAKPEHQVQIIYTQIDRDAANRPRFTTHTYSVDKALYFYPASTVKLPAALLALEKMNKVQITGLDRNAVMINGVASSPQTAATQDPTSANGLPSLAHYIRKLFIVSDNDAFNRIYEYLGQEYLTRRLWEKGYYDARILHRLSVSGFDAEANRHTNPVSFYTQPPAGQSIEQSTLLFHQGEVYSKASPKFSLRNELRGKGYINPAGDLVNEPFDFRQRNYIALQDLHDIVQAVMFPDAVPDQRRFRMSEDDYRFVWRCMSELPRESDYPSYPEKDYEDGYVKFLLYGDTKERIPGHIRIFNKVGNAYGFLTDAAYIVDIENGVEFLLAATVHVNANEIFNDGVYEYDAVGFPFLANLGRVVYAHELQRARKHRPDLTQLLEAIAR